MITAQEAYEAALKAKDTKEAADRKREAEALKKATVRLNGIIKLELPKHKRAIEKSIKDTIALANGTYAVVYQITTAAVTTSEDKVALGGKLNDWLVERGFKVEIDPRGHLTINFQPPAPNADDLQAAPDDFR